MFDAFIFADWSATNKLTAKQPRKDAIWVGSLFPEATVPTTTYHRSRRSAFEQVRCSLIDAVRRKIRVLVGFDFAYGYPAGFTVRGSDGVDRSGWMHVWNFLAEHVTDDATNCSNRFQVAEHLNACISVDAHGPFWGHPPKRSYAALKPTSPGFPHATRSGRELERLRLCERALPGVQETWKLFGNGSVGSQTLVGIPYLHELRYAPELRADSRVWPFETNFAEQLGQDAQCNVVHAEVWPGIVKSRVSEWLTVEPHAIKDAAQVRELCLWARAANEAGMLEELLSAPGWLTAAQHVQCVGEEGWILGAR